MGDSIGMSISKKKHSSMCFPPPRALVPRTRALMPSFICLRIFGGIKKINNEKGVIGDIGEVFGDFSAKFVGVM